MKNKITMFKRWIMIICNQTSVAVKQRAGQCYSRDRIAGYYNDLTGKVCTNTELDEEGIPVTIIGGGERVYFPIAIFQYGLGCYDLFLLTGENKYKEMFCRIVLWAENHMNEDGSWDCFSHLKSKKYNFSSMCQAEGASVLFRAYRESETEKYKEMAEKAIDFMLVPVEKGGTTIYEESGVFFEEYPQKERRSVLNGWIFSIFGLYDAKLENPIKYKILLDKTVNTLIENLEKYDLGYWSKYDLEGNIASPAYHELHIELLSVMYALVGRKELNEMKEVFSKYQKNYLYKTIAIIFKMIQKIVTDSDSVVVK